MKKLVSLFLALAIVFAMSIPAFAEGTDSTTLTIVDEGERTYAGYLLLNLTTSLKSGTHHTDHAGDHVDDCYNYAYTVNEKYRTILQNEVFSNGGNYLWTDGVKPTDATKVTDDQILKYISNQASDNGDVYQTMRMVADRLYRAIQTAGLAADAGNLTGDKDNIAQGYWMFADVTDLNNEHEANSLVMVDTKGQNALTIKSKTALPTVEKKVKDIEDSEDDSILDNPWHDSADHDIGDKVPFKLTATLPSNAQYYTSFTMKFHDTLSAGLTLDVSSIKVLMYDTKYKADVDTDMNDAAKDVTDKFTLPTTAASTFTVSCDNLFTIEGVTKDTAFVVYYEATLNEAAVIGSAGNPNEVYLEFSNNPYDSTSTGETEPDKVIVFTYQLIINKTDAHNHPLEGAGFTLSKKNVDGTYTVIGTELKGTDMTTFTWVGLDDGDYKLEETTVPEGYNKMSDIIFAITAVHTETAGEPALQSLDGGVMGTGVVDIGAIEKDIVNNTGTVLPETGAEGTFMLVCGGTILVVIAAVFMITRKKMSIYEA